MVQQQFGSSLARPWALIKWNAGTTPGRRPATTVVYLTDDCGDGYYLGGLVEFYQKRSTLRAVRDATGTVVRYDTAVPGDVYARWHFRFSRPRKFHKDDVVSFFPNGKSRDDGPHKTQIAAAKKAVPKNPEDEARAA